MAAVGLAPARTIEQIKTLTIELLANQLHQDPADLRRELEGKGGLMPVDSLDMFDILQEFRARNRSHPPGQVAEAQHPPLRRRLRRVRVQRGQVVATEEEAATLANRLREAREFANLSQGFVAEQTGLSRSAISEIERGQRRVESLELKRLAAVYRMPIEYFLGSDDAELAGDATDQTVQALTREPTT